jgi:hypothetical protein
MSGGIEALLPSDAPPTLNPKNLRRSVERGKDKRTWERVLRAPDRAGVRGRHSPREAVATAGGDGTAGAGGPQGAPSTYSPKN